MVGGNFSWRFVVSCMGFHQPYASVCFVGWLDCSTSVGCELWTFSLSHHLSHGGIVFLNSATNHCNSKGAREFYSQRFLQFGIAARTALWDPINLVHQLALWANGIAVLL
jgi:hypothetical protein